MYEKNFDEWNEVKKKIGGTNYLIVRTGEIWFCRLGVNIGFETDGKKEFIRPVIVIKSYGESGAIICPITSKIKNKNFHYKIDEKNYVKLTQIRFIDSRRFVRIVRVVDLKILNQIKLSVINLL